MSDRSIIVFGGLWKTITCHKNGQNVDHPITTFGFFRILNSRFLISKIETKKLFQKAKNEIRKEKLKSVRKNLRLVRDKREKSGRKIRTASSGARRTCTISQVRIMWLRTLNKAKRIPRRRRTVIGRDLYVTKFSIFGRNIFQFYESWNWIRTIILPVLVKEIGWTPWPGIPALSTGVSSELEPWPGSLLKYWS